MSRNCSTRLRHQVFAHRGNEAANKHSDAILLEHNISEPELQGLIAEAHSIPVIPHAGQMHNYHIVMASLNSPMAEFFPQVDVEVGNELFWYCFDGEPIPVDGYIDLDENTHGLGLTVNEDNLKNFEVIE